MSIGSLGTVGSLAAAASAQRTTDADKVAHAATVHGREVQAIAQAERSAGIGETEEDAQTSERDADGRRLWENPLSGESSNAAAESEEPSHAGKDPSGDTGQKLDLLG